jgi:hypothetical protein
LASSSSAQTLPPRTLDHQLVASTSQPCAPTPVHAPPQFSKPPAAAPPRAASTVRPPVLSFMSGWW